MTGEAKDPYTIDSKGTVWVALLRVGMVARIDPQTMEVTRFKEGDRVDRA